MKKRGRIIFLTLVSAALGCGLLIGCSGGAAQAKEPIKIGAIFSVTGPASYLGGPEAKTAEMLVEKLNAAGGIAGKQVKLLVRDTQGSSEKAVSFTKQLIEEEKVLAVIGPSTSGESMAIKNLCQEAKTILISCAAAETIVEPVASYVFKTPQKDSYAAIWIYRTMKEMGISRIGVVTGNDGFGKGGKSQLEKYAPEYGIEIAISEVYDAAATDLTGVLAKLKAKNVQAVVNWSVVPAQSIVAKNMRQLGMTVPLFQSHGFGNIKYVEAAGQAAEGILFPCGRLLVAEALPEGHSQKKVLSDYVKEYESRYQEEVSTFGGHAWDAFMLLAEAIRRSEPQKGIDKERVRSALENLKDFVGTAGVFSMTPQDHNGLDMSSFEMLTVKEGRFALYRK